jgi:DNA polymerase
MKFMSGAYEELLDATIQHLENLKSRGVRHVAVAPETLRALVLPAKSPAAAPRSRTPASPASVAARPRAAASAHPLSRPAAPFVPPPPAPAPRPAAAAEVPPLPGASPAAEKPPLDPAAKAAAFAELRTRALACVKCPNLVSARKNVVFGVGNPDARLMFVGEAPGADEDAQGEPFVGRAGELLTKIIQATGLKRSDVYIANILKCRPDTPGQASGNRKPTPGEMATCIPFLHEQIDLIRPRVLVALGATAVEGLLGKTLGITKLRGTWKTYRGIPLMPTYHPAYLLRNQSLTEKRRVWEDMLAVMEKLAMPISDKQRNYFLKS